MSKFFGSSISEEDGSEEESESEEEYEEESEEKKKKPTKAAKSPAPKGAFSARDPLHSQLP